MTLSSFFSKLTSLMSFPGKMASLPLVPKVEPMLELEVDQDQQPEQELEEGLEPEPAVEVKPESLSGLASDSEPEPEFGPEPCAVCGVSVPAASLPPAALFDLRLAGGHPAAAAVLPLRRLDVTAEWRLCADCWGLLGTRQRLRSAAVLRAARAELDGWAARVTAGAGETAPADGAGRLAERARGVDRIEHEADTAGGATGTAGSPHRTERSAGVVNESESAATSADSAGHSDRPVSSAAPSERTAECADLASRADPVNRPVDSVDVTDRPSGSTSPSASADAPAMSGADPVDRTGESQEPSAAAPTPREPADGPTLEQQLAAVERQLLARAASAPTEPDEVSAQGCGLLGTDAIVE